MKRTQKQLVEAVQQSEAIGNALANLAIAIDTGSLAAKEQTYLLSTAISEVYYLKNEDLEDASYE